MLKPLGLELQVVLKHPVWVLGTENDPLQKQYVLLTADPSLRLLLTFIFAENFTW